MWGLGFNPLKSKWVFQRLEGIQTTESSGERTPNSSKQNVKYNPLTDEREKPLLANISEASDSRTGGRNNKVKLSYASSSVKYTLF